MITVRGTIPYPPTANAAPVRALAANLRHLSTGLQNASSQLDGVARTTQSSWQGQAANAFTARVGERSRTVATIARSAGNAAPVLDALAAAIDSTSAAYSTAAAAEHAARAGLPWTSGALAAAIAAQSAALTSLQAAGVACGTRLWAINAEIAAAQFFGVSREQFTGIRDAVMGVWETIKDTITSGDQDTIAAATTALSDTAAFSTDATPPASQVDWTLPGVSTSIRDNTSWTTGDHVSDTLATLGLTPTGQTLFGTPVSIGEPLQCVPGLAAELHGTEPHAMDRTLAAASHHVYDPPAVRWEHRQRGDEVGLFKVTDGSLDAPPGLTRLGRADLSPSLIGRFEVSDTGIIQDRRTGFAAAIYRHDDGGHVVAYRGTDEYLRDIGGNALAQSLWGGGRQYDQALALGRAAHAEYGGNVVFTGHSLGGAHASLAAIVTGSPAVTFQAQGLHDTTMQNAGVDPVAARNAAESGLVRRYTTPGDVLTNVQEHFDGREYVYYDNLGLTPKQRRYPSVPEGIGHHIQLPGNGWHGIGALVDGMDEHHEQYPWDAPEPAPSR